MSIASLVSFEIWKKHDRAHLKGYRELLIMKKNILVAIAATALLTVAPLTATFAAENGVTATTAKNLTGKTDVTAELTPGDLSLDQVTGELDFGAVSVADVLNGDTDFDAQTIATAETDATGTTNGWILSADYTTTLTSVLEVNGENLSSATTAVLTNATATKSTTDATKFTDNALTANLTATADPEALAGNYTGTINWTLTSGVEG